MGLFDFFKIKTQQNENQITESYRDIENEYLLVKSTDNIYGFLIITDTHNTLDENKLVQIVNEHPDFNVCLLLGDHSDSDIKKVLNHVSKDKIYALLGNHDVNYIANYNLNNLNGKIIDINGVRLLGIQGSFKYKPVDFPSFTQEESIKFLKDKEPVDILISHDGPFNDQMINNPAHQGLFGITYYLFKNKVKYNLKKFIWCELH